MTTSSVDRARSRARVALAACGATLAVMGAASLLPPPPPAADYMRGSAPHWVTASAAALGVACALLALVRPHLQGGMRTGVVAMALVACVLLFWSAAGVIFDLLRTAAVLGIPGMPPSVDWLGFAGRVSALAGVVTLAVATRSLAGEGLSEPLRGSRLAGWSGYAALILAFPYPMLKIYWMLGGTLGWRAGWERHAAVAETAMLVAMAALPLALVRPWGRVLPRPLLLIAGWGSSAALGSMGALAAFGTAAATLGIVRGPAGFDPGAWIVDLAYGDWLLLGLALAAATLAYQYRTRTTPLA
jgi:hypothetical protein